MPHLPRFRSPFFFACAALLILATGRAQTQVTLQGAGASFPYPMYSAWFDAYSRIDSSVRFNYRSIGSSNGQRQMLEGLLDFGASDGPMTDETLAQAPGKILHIPTVAGAVVITFNAPGISELNLDGETMADIFLGKITKWNDPALVRLNPKIKLPKLDVTVIHRSDGSGTTYIWTDFLSRRSPAWKEQIGTKGDVAWPVGIGARGNEGVFDQVQQWPGSIGYIELTYALQNQMPMAAVKNKAGEFVKPNFESISAAISATQIPDDFRFSMVNADGPSAYPISSATWLLVYQHQKNPVTGRKLVEFLKWIMTDGEKMAPDYQYAPLPEPIRKRVLTEIDLIRAIE